MRGACLLCTLSPLCLTAQIKLHTSLPRVPAHTPDTHNWDKIKICSIYARIKYSECFHAVSGFRRLCKFTNGRTQHILILFRKSNVLLSQESVIYSQSRWAAMFPEHPYLERRLAGLTRWALPLLLACVGPLGNFPHPMPCLSLNHHNLTAGQSLPWESLSAAINWPANKLGRGSVEGGVCNLLPEALIHMLFSLYKESVAYLEI